jgi:hypothetical protein
MNRQIAGAEQGTHIDAVCGHTRDGSTDYPVRWNQRDTGGTGDTTVVRGGSAQGVLHLSGDKTRKEQRGRQHPLGYVSRENAHAPSPCGFDLVILSASWERFRVPVAIAPIALESKGHQNLLFRHMLQTFALPAWGRQVVVSAEAGFAANGTLQLIDDLQWTYVFARPRTRKFTNGKSLRDLVRHLPTSCYRRRASATPDGRRRDY